MKKILCLILTFVIVVSSVSVFAREYYSGFDFMDDIFKYDVGDFVAGKGSVNGGREDGAETETIMFLDSLGLWDDASVPAGELVTMQSFSKILSKIKLGSDNAFSDIYDLNPSDEYATYNHAYTYLVEALGYSHKCRQYPNSADANLIVAAQIGLLSERPENANSYITYAELAKLIFRAMHIDLCVVEYPSQGGYSYTVVPGKTLLNSIHGISLVEGFVNGIPGMNVYGSDKIREGYIQINRQEVKDGGMDLTEYFGSRVSAYTRYDSSKDEHTIIAIDYEENSEAFQVDFRNLLYVNNNEIGYTDEDGNDEIYDVSDLSNILLNGEKLDSISQLNEIFPESEGSIHFEASTDADVIDTAIIYSYNYYVVNNVDTRLFKIALRFNRTYNSKSYIQLDEHAPMNVYIDGVKSDYTKLTPGSIIKFFKCPSTGYVSIDAKSMNAITAEPQSLYDNIVVFNGKEYRVAKDWENFVDKNKDNGSIIVSQRPKELQLGTATTFYVIDNVIAAYTSTQSYKYGFIKSITQSRTSIDPQLTFRIFNQDGEWAEYVLNDKLEFEGQQSVSKDTLLATINNEARKADFFDHPVRFRVNGENKLVALDTIYESSYELNSSEDIVFTQNCGMARDWTYENLGRDVPFFLSEKTTIFVYPDGSDDESDLKIITNTQMPPADGGNLLPTRVYNINDYCQISLLVVTKGVDASGGTSSGTYYVEKITNAVLDADDQIYGYKVSGKQFVGPSRANGVLKDFFFYVDEKTINKNEVVPGEEGYTTDNIIEVGDLINASLTGSNVISWDMVLKGGIVPEPTPLDDGVSDQFNVSTDTYRAVGKFVRADAESGVWVTNVDGISRPSIPRVPVIINPNTKKIIKATISDFVEGEPVYYRAQFGHTLYYIKNEY